MRTILLTFVGLTLPLLGSLRVWRNPEATRSFEAEFVSSDGTRVTLRRNDGRFVNLELARLHRDDQAWVRTRIPPKRPAPGVEPSGAAFDTLEFGDSRAEVERKLKASPAVQTGLDGTFLGRTGLNGVFRTTKTLGGLHCYLFFDWTVTGTLREVTLRSEPVGRDLYQSLLRRNWEELLDLLAKLHGKARHESSFPPLADLQDGLILGSHLWQTEDGHSILLGTGQERDSFVVAVRFSSGE